jgi:putative ATP-binding cassette transporter
MRQFMVLATVYIVMYVYKIYLQQWLQIRWRRWMTERYLGEWLGNGVYYRMQITAERTDNPDQRIAEDLNLFVDESLSLFLGLLDAVVTLASFVTILWGLSGALEFTLGGTTWEIYGYMVWVAIAYAAIGSVAAHWIGRPLIRLNFDQQRYEADFRFGLARFRDQTEAVAFFRGERQELQGFRTRFAAVAQNWWELMKRQKLFNFYASGYGQLATVFPFLVGAPRYFSGAIPLGGLMQISNAFSEVQRALSWFINVYPSVARWRATVDRLAGFHKAVEDALAGAKHSPGVTRTPSDGGALELHDPEIRKPDGGIVVAGGRLAVAPGEHVAIRGASGSGKSTLFRTLAGIWPFASGTLKTPGGFDPMFLPQRPYFPLGTLRSAVAYPSAPEAFGDDRIREVLGDVGLDSLHGALDETSHWGQRLSGGEQQRVAFARALLHRPAWLFLDEATSNLDEDAERALLALLRARLPDSAIVVISHHPDPAGGRMRVVELVRGAALAG